MGEPLIDIRPDHWAIVRDILQRHVPQFEVWAFGSRATWKAKEYSDLDLAVITDKPLSLAVSAALADDFSESDLPWKVDVVDWAPTSEAFRKIIERDKVIVQSAKTERVMAGEWREVVLEDVASDITVGHVGPMASEYVMEGTPFFRSQNVDYLRIDTNDTKFITPEFHQRLKKSSLSPGDVVIVQTGKPGTCAVIPRSLPKANCSDLVIVRCSHELDPRFLAYYVNSIATRHVAAHLVGAVQQHFNVGSARKMQLRLPNIDEQLAIVEILGTLDDKIELNRRINETLEAIARATFKSWFVDFDPVRAKAGGEEPEFICRRLGLTPDLLALFPDRLVDSGLGEIPEGWEVRTVGDVIERLSVGKKYEQKTVKVMGKVPVLDQGKSGKIGYHDDEPGVTASIDHPVAVFANHTCYMRLIHFPFSAIQNVLPFVGKSVDTIWAFHATFGKQSFIEYKGHWPDFLIHNVVVPGTKLTNEFSRVVHPLLKMAWEKESESNTLGTLRDTLLPKLLSGELRVPSKATA